MPKVSILVPIYNVEKYLRQCLDSLANQTLVDIEVICINDGSTDSSKQIIEEYCLKDSRFKLIDKANSGYGDSMNKGLEAATGEFVGIVEPDDFVEHCMYEKLYGVTQKYPHVDLVKSDWYRYTTANNESKKVKKIKKEGLIDIKDNQDLLQYQAIWTGLYKREFLNNYQIRFLPTPGASYQDTAFAFKTFTLAKNIYLTSQAYLHYRTDNENSSVKSKEKVFFICDEHEEIAKFINKYPDLKNSVLVTQRINQYNAYKWNLLRIDSQFRDEFLLRVQETFRKYVEEKSIPNDFFKVINKNEFNLLISDIAKYKTLIETMQQEKRNRVERRKKFSIQIMHSRLNIILFGKKIL